MQLWLLGYVLLFVVMNGAERWYKCEGKAKPSVCFGIWYVLRLCFVFFVVDPYLLICIVPLMSVKFPVKLTEDKSFYLSDEKKKRRKNNPEQPICRLKIHFKTSQDRVPLLCYGNFIVWCSTFFRLNSKIVLKYTHPMMCVGAYFTFFPRSHTFYICLKVFQKNIFSYCFFKKAVCEIDSTVTPTG